MKFKDDNDTMKETLFKEDEIMNKKAPGKGLLKVVGIILIVLGVFGFIGAVSNIFMANMMAGGQLDAATQSIYEQAGITAETFKSGIALSFLQGALYLAAGVLGVVNCNKIERAKICFIFGILLLVYVLGANLYSAVTSPFSVMNVISIVISLILPLLYFWGALKNRQAMEESQNSTFSS